MSVVRERRNGSRQPAYGSMGDRLRQARHAQGLSLRRLAEVLDVSPSLISQVETGRAKPSVSTLYALANELGMSLDELMFMDTPAVPLGAGQLPSSEPLADSLPMDPVQRADSRMSIRLGSGVVWERLTTASIRSVDFLYVTYEVGGASSPEDSFQRHQGQEWGYLLSGSLGVKIGFEEFVLGPGDAITFDSARPHRLFNAGDEPVRAVWFVLGRGSTATAIANDGIGRPQVWRG